MLKKIKDLQKGTSQRPHSTWSALLMLTIPLLALVAVAVNQSHTVAQDITDEVLAQQLEPKILSQTMTATGLNTVVEIPASRDTYIASNLPNTNFGTSPELRLGYNLSGANNGALRPLVYYDISVIPSRAVINSARERAYLFEATPVGDAPMGFITRHLVSSWNENLVTWNSHQPDWGGVSAQAEAASTLGWQEGDVTRIVRDWHSGAHANNGEIYIGDERVQERQRKYWSLNANNGLYPRLIVDYTVSTDTTPPTASVNALPQWSMTSFTVSWGGSDNPGGSGISHYDVQYSVNGSVWTNWQMHTTRTSAQFVGGQNGSTYRFRARAVDKAGNVQAWTGSQAQTTVDSIPPTVSMDPLPEFTVSEATFVSWRGSDNPGGSGIATYDVEWREQGGAWQKLLENTTATTIQVTGGRDSVTYEFRARGRDNAGNVQPHSATAQAWTTVVLHPVSTILPFSPPIVRHTDPVTDSFTVEWAGFVAPGTSISLYEVRYRFQNGSWQTWRTTANTSDVFVIPNAEDGIYDFEVSATNNLGQSEPFTGVPEARMIVDRLPPYVTPKAYLPLAFKNATN